MNLLRHLRIAALLSICLSVGSAAADPTTVPARVCGETPDEVKLPQVVITGKRLNTEEKARMAREESNQKDHKMMSRKSPRKPVKLTRGAG